jgi:DNA-binding transcriptional ArsR family regulator
VVNNQAQLDRSFLALAHPARRAIVERLVRGPATVGEATRRLGISKPAVTKHLKVLEGVGVVDRTVEGRRHWLRLVPQPLDDAAGWFDRHRSLWESKFDAIEQHLSDEADGGS